MKDFIRAKREDGRLRQFNLSLLITDGFMDAVANDGDWPLVFPINVKEQGDIDLDDADQVVWREWPTHKNYVTRDDGLVACKIYGHIRARHLWDMIMVSTYDYAEPGFILIDRVNEMNNNWWCENIRATNPCGEQPLPPYGACLLGSVNLTKFVRNPFTDQATLRLGGIQGSRARVHPHARQRGRGQRPAAAAAARRDHAQAPPRHGLPRPGQHRDHAADEVRLEGVVRVHRAHRPRDGRGRLGNGPGAGEGKGRRRRSWTSASTVTAEMLRKRPEMVARRLEARPADRGQAAARAATRRYMQRVAEVAPELVDELAEVGARFTHHSSIAPDRHDLAVAGQQRLQRHRAERSPTTTAAT